MAPDGCAAQTLGRNAKKYAPHSILLCNILPVLCYNTKSYDGGPGVGKRLAALFAVLFMALLLGDFAAQQPAPRPAYAAVEADIFVAAPPRTAADPLPAFGYKPASAPVANITDPWYKQRNALLRDVMRRYNPALPKGEINQAVYGMRIDPDKPMVALTFDDGPMPGVTDRILDILARYNARATFFVCGWRFQNEQVQQIARRAVALGCEIGNHSFDHRDMLRLNIVEKRNEIQNTNQIIFDATGYTAHVFRPPGGHMDWDVNRVSRENDMAVALWAQSGNVNEYDPAKIAQNVKKQIVDGKTLRNGDIILLHDTKAHMVDAVERIVPQLIAEGYQLVTVWELLNFSEAGFIPGETYYHR